MSAGHTELRPCPFCGGDELSHGWSAPGVDGSATTGEVQCHNCNAVIWTDTESEAITAWNTREAAEADLLGKALAALREIRRANPMNINGAIDSGTWTKIDAILSQAREVK